jgi:hypothetical protein
MIIESLTIMFAYIHLRIAKGEVVLAGSVTSATNTSSPAQEAHESFGDTEESETPTDGGETEDTPRETENAVDKNTITEQTK